jgi:hypothetical protein
VCYIISNYALLDVSSDTTELYQYQQVSFLQIPFFYFSRISVRILLTIVCLFIIFPLATALSHLQITISDYPIGYSEGYGIYRHFQQYFSYIVAVSFIAGGNRVPAASH